MRAVAGWMLPLATLLLGGDKFAEGMRAYEEGRFADALAAFAQAEKDAGDRASAELLYNKALAALRANELVEAESSAEESVARGGPQFAARRDFLFGSAAFARCERAEEEASQPNADPSALDRAIAHAEAARISWQLAAASRLDWPEARRNVARALLKLSELKKKRDEAQKKRQEEEKKKERQPEPRPLPPPPQPDEQDGAKKPEPAPTPEPQRDALSPEEVLRLLDKLAEKEKEKLELRRVQRRSQKVAVEKDW